MIEHNMILSASGWRKVFAESGDGEDADKKIGTNNRSLCALIAETFAEYLHNDRGIEYPRIAVGMDTRPTSKEIADVIVRVLIQKDIYVVFTAVTAAPEIMAYARSLDGFLYISASHNPIGYNGIKFGLNNGGVLKAAETYKLIQAFVQKCAADDAEVHAQGMINSAQESIVKQVYANSPVYKLKSLEAYTRFIRQVITNVKNQDNQVKVFNIIKEGLKQTPISLVCDMNGSARTLSIDNKFFTDCGLEFLPFNDQAGQIVHAIIPEPENLVHCQDVIQDLHADGNANTLIGYMPDCDGDRGNIVYWDEDSNLAKAIPAQEVFALSVVAENAFDCWLSENVDKQGLLWKAQASYGKRAVVVNGPTSMRIDKICSYFGTEIFRAEVGEANVVNLARKKRDEGYTVRILGEGSNGGNITYPSSVRDPVATIFAIIKLLTIRDCRRKDGTFSKGLFHIWCEKSGQGYLYKNDFTLSDIMATLPKYTTTGVSEERALLQVKTQDKGIFKARFQRVFNEEWNRHKNELNGIYGFATFKADTTNGTHENKDISYWNNANGGLKIRFQKEDGKDAAFIWMRPSGTEPVFRIMCDVAGTDEAAERSLLRWETTMIKKADLMGLND